MNEGQAKVEHKIAALASVATPGRDFKQIALQAANEQQLRQAFNDSLSRLMAELTPEEIAAELERRGITNYIMR